MIHGLSQAALVEQFASIKMPFGVTPITKGGVRSCRYFAFLSICTAGLAGAFQKANDSGGHSKTRDAFVLNAHGPTNE
ncbi:MAG: hypothetical protein BRD54_06630 [Bacteroidetes bacterium SW_8_64_56]|nr:MAG: hypothetical protein BRD54_06630 [Bacteroidetes bacterium SW_8_64_56]